MNTSAIAIPERVFMRRFLHFLIAHQLLVRHRWLYHQVRLHLFHPAVPRDADQIKGMIDIGPDASPEAVAAFRRWWDRFDND